VPGPGNYDIIEASVDTSGVTMPIQAGQLLVVRNGVLTSANFEIGGELWVREDGRIIDSTVLVWDDVHVENSAVVTGTHLTNARDVYLDAVSDDPNFASVEVLLGENPGVLIEQAQQTNMLMELTATIDALNAPFGNPTLEMEMFDPVDLTIQAPSGGLPDLPGPSGPSIQGSGTRINRCCLGEGADGRT
jgi:hypothetical protein